MTEPILNGSFTIDGKAFTFSATPTPSGSYQVVYNRSDDTTPVIYADITVDANPTTEPLDFVVEVLDIIAASGLQT